ncbi:MAG: transposase, partial [Bacteroidetes bacterium]|nr:transposase [Bacteroidota bacterium]
MKIVRSNTLKIKCDIAQDEALASTLAIYRRYVRDLMILINARWRTFEQENGNSIIKAVEALIHPTAKRPTVKHAYFHRRYYKFTSYLRRVAIMDAAGQVRSFQSRFNEWTDGKRKQKPPTLTCSTATFPSLYAGQCIKFNPNNRQAQIKVFTNNDWVWITVALSGKKRFNGKDLSPLLVVKRKKWSLSLPTQLQVTLKDKKDFSGKVLSVDVGINTTATCAVVDKQGTVHERIFINRSDKDRESRIM